MDRNLQELLAGFRVREDWQARAEEYQRLARTSFSVAISALLMSLLVLGLFRLRSMQNQFALFVHIQVVWFFLLAVGSWSITRVSTRRLPRYLWIALSAGLTLIALIFVSWRIGLIQAVDQAVGRAYMLFSLLPLVILGAGIGSSLLADCRTSPFCLLSTTWRLRALFYGTCAGVVLIFQQLLAAAFSGLPWIAPQPEPLYSLQWSMTLILVQPLAEESIFRATIFDYLHKIRNVDLWIAVVISVVLNLLIYLPALPPALHPDQASLFLLGPAMLAMTNALLWTWERGLNACVACNFTFCLLRVLLQ